MKKYVEKSLILTLALMLALSSTGCMCTYLTYRGVEEALKTPAPTAEPLLMDFGTAAKGHSDVHFTDMRFDEPDIAALHDEIDAMQSALSDGVDAETLFSRFDAALRAFESADSELSLLYVKYALDVTKTEYQDQYAELLDELQGVDIALTDLAMAILDSPAYGAEARTRWGEDFVNAVIEGDRLSSPEIQEDLAAEQKLTFEYDNIISGYTLNRDGREWTLDAAGEAYYAGELAFEDYLSIYSDYCAGLNEAAGAVFLKLLPLRERIAKTLGYGSYAAYRYECYSRDYTVEDAKALHAAVKKYISPLYAEAVSVSTAAYELKDVTFSLNGYLAALQRMTEDFAPEVSEALNYMLRNGLYDFEVSSNKMVGSFTTYFSDERAPFMFSQWEGSAGNVRTVIHELGHFTRFYQGISDGWCVTESLDLDEVDSQALELLFTAYYDTFFGGNIDAAVSEMLLDGMYAVITGCMEDEFQQEIYQNPSMTLDEINALYKRLAGEYGFDDLYGYDGTEWVMISHTFQSPMYYISYAVSIIAAFEIWQESLADYDAAREDYVSILKRPAYSELRRTTSAYGLGDPLSAETVRNLAETLRAQLIEEN